MNSSNTVKKLLGILILVCLSNIIIAQNLSNLDSKYGIKKFKLESSYDNYKSSLELELDGKVKYYKYVGSDIQSVFGQDISKVILGFYKNKLYYVNLILDDSQPIYSDLVYDKLKQLFGSTEKATTFNKGPLSYDWAYFWQTKKTYLSFDKQLPNNQQAGRVTIWMISNVLDDQIAADDF
ncbi:hypothetical protein ES705_30850 [subsurface metagenome]